MSRRSRSNRLGLGTLGLRASPTSPKKSYRSLSLHPLFPLSIHPSPLSRVSCAMPVFSRPTVANHHLFQEDGPGSRFGSQDVLSTPPPSKKRSGLADPDFSRSALVDGSHRQNSDISFHHSGFESSPGFHLQPGRAQASKGYYADSPISISSTDHNPTNVELVQLRKENIELKIENGQLRGQVKGLA
jgi:hypothetical protein